MTQYHILNLKNPAVLHLRELAANKLDFNRITKIGLDIGACSTAKFADLEMEMRYPLLFRRTFGEIIVKRDGRFVLRFSIITAYRMSSASLLSFINLPINNSLSAGFIP